MAFQLAEGFKEFRALSHLGIERTVGGIRSSLVSLDRAVKSSVGGPLGARGYGLHRQTLGQAPGFSATNPVEIFDTDFANVSDALRKVLSEYVGQNDDGKRGNTPSPATTGAAGVGSGVARHRGQSEKVFGASGLLGAQQVMLRQLRAEFGGAAHAALADALKRLSLGGLSVTNGSGTTNSRTPTTVPGLHHGAGHTLEKRRRGELDTDAGGRSFSRGFAHGNALGNIGGQVANQTENAASASPAARPGAPSNFNIGELANRIQNSINNKQARDMKKAADEAARQNENQEQIITLIGQFSGVAFQ